MYEPHPGDGVPKTEEQIAELLRNDEFVCDEPARDLDLKLSEMISATDFHEAVSHLDHANIAAFYSPELAPKGSNTVYAETRVVSQRDREQYDVDWHFVVRINHHEWIDLNDTKRAAVLEHELYHMQLKGDAKKPTLRPHQVEDFAPVIQRYGLYLDRYKSVARAIQPHLPGFERDEQQQEHTSITAGVGRGLLEGLLAMGEGDIPKPTEDEAEEDKAA